MTPPTPDDNCVLIVGGGVAGLVLAQGLKSRNIPFKLFERDSSVVTKGYRFRVVDDALDALQRTLPQNIWDRFEQTHPQSSPPELLILDAATAEQTGRLPTKDDRSYPVDRPWLKQLLHDGIEDRVYFNKKFQSYKLLDDNRVRVTFEDQATVTGRLLVGADGVHSKTRCQFLPHYKLLDVERTIIWGRTPLNHDFEQKFAHPEILAEHFSVMVDSKDPRRCCLFAPIRWPHDGKLSQVSPKLSDQADYIFWALSFETPPPGVSLNSSEARKAYSLSISRDWDRNLCNMFKNPTESSAIAVHSSSPEIPAWATDDRITFMGDSIHAMSPAGGSGGFSAILDAAALCDTLNKSYDRTGQWNNLEERLATYESDLRKRARDTINHSFLGGKMLWAGSDWTSYAEVE